MRRPLVLGSNPLPALLCFSALAVFPLDGAVGADAPRCEILEEWMPADVIAYGKVHDLAPNLRKLLKSDFFKRLEATAIGKAVEENEKYREFLDLLSRFRRVTEKDPENLVAEVLGTEVAAGVRLTLAGPEVIVMTRATSPRKLESRIGVLKNFVVDVYGVWPFPAAENYEGYALHGTEKLAYTTLGEVLVVSNSVSGLRGIVDIARGAQKRSVKNSETFANASPATSKEHLLAVVARPQYLPEQRITEEADNFVGSLLVGGWLGTLRASELLTINLKVDAKGLELELNSSSEDETVDERLQSFSPVALPSPIPGSYFPRVSAAISAGFRCPSGIVVDLGDAQKT